MWGIDLGTLLDASSPRQSVIEKRLFASQMCVTTPGRRDKWDNVLVGFDVTRSPTPHHKITQCLDCTMSSLERDTARSVKSLARDHLAARGPGSTFRLQSMMLFGGVC